MKRTKTSRFPLLCAALAVAAGAAWFGTRTTDTASPAVAASAAPAPIPVRVMTLTSQQVTAPLTLNADALAQETVNITSQVSELVTAIHFDEGSQVRRGDLLLELEQREEQSNLASQQTLLDEAKRTLERTEHLVKRAFVSRAAVDKAASAFAQAQQQLAVAQHQLRIRTLRAPFNGVIGVRYVSVGSLVQDGQTIATLLDLSRIRVDMHIPERYATLIAVGDAFRVTTDAYPNRPFDGTITVIEQQIAPSTRTVRVRGTIPNADAALKAGMLLRAQLTYRTIPMLLVPEASLIPIGNEFFVYSITQDNIATRRKVQIGTRINDFIELRSGIEAGEKIVIEGQMKLRDGAHIVVNSDKT